MEQTIYKQITDHILEFDKLDEPKDINSGWCFIWAYIAHQIYPSSRFVQTAGHVWIKADGKHYDSEHFGVSDEEIKKRYSSYREITDTEFELLWGIQLPKTTIVSSFFTNHKEYCNGSQDRG